MNPSRLFLVVVAGCCLLRPESLVAQTFSPFDLSKQYSADQVITTKEGVTMTNKVYFDGGKMRTEMNASGMQMVSIVRPDQKKVYTVMPAQKIVMERPYDAEKMQKMMAPASAADGKFEVVGPDTVEGVVCTKYKITSNEGTVSFMWVDTAKKVPVKMASEDGTFTLLWKNYKEGPQDAALFEPPADYQKVAMPGGAGGPGAPGGGQ